MRLLGYIVTHKLVVARLTVDESLMVDSHSQDTSGEPEVVHVVLIA